MPFISSTTRTAAAAAAAATTHSKEANLSKFQRAVSAFSNNPWRKPSLSSPQPGTVPHHRNPVTVMSAFSRSGQTDEVIRIFRSIPHPPSVHCYNTLLNSLLVSGRFDHAHQLLDEMLNCKVSPSIATYTILFKNSMGSIEHNADDVYKFIDTVRRNGCCPDVVAYTVVIDVLCRYGRLQEALGVVDYMLEMKLAPTVSAFTCILRGYCLEGRINDAKKLMSIMEETECLPDSMTYSVLIEAFCERGEFEEVERVLSECKTKGWQPDVVNYNIYMSGLCRMGRTKEAFRQLDVMLNSGLCPTVETLNILFDCLCRESMVWEAWSLLERSVEMGWEVDIFFFNTLMSRFCDIGNWLVVLELFVHVVKKGHGPSACTNTVVIRSLCMAGMLHDAKYFICSKEVIVDAVAYTTLMHWFYKDRKFDEVKSLFYSMELVGIFPNKFAFCIMIDTLCSERKFSEAVNFLAGSVKNRYKVDVIVRLANWLIRFAKLRDLLVLFDGILRRGLYIDVYVFCSVIRAFCKEGYCKRMHVEDKIIFILETMLRLR